MAKYLDVDSQELEKWLKTKPSIIRELVATRPPGIFYQYQGLKFICTIASYFENKKAKVAIAGDHNLIYMDRCMIVDAYQLIECDAPSEDKTLGTVLKETEIDEYIKLSRPYIVGKRRIDDFENEEIISFLKPKVDRFIGEKSISREKFFDDVDDRIFNSVLGGFFDHLI